MPKHKIEIGSRPIIAGSEPAPARGEGRDEVSVYHEGEGDVTLEAGAAYETEDADEVAWLSERAKIAGADVTITTEYEDPLLRDDYAADELRKPAGAAEPAKAKAEKKPAKE